MAICSVCGAEFGVQGIPQEDGALLCQACQAKKPPAQPAQRDRPGPAPAPIPEGQRRPLRRRVLRRRVEAEPPAEEQGGWPKLTGFYKATYWIIAANCVGFAIMILMVGLIGVWPEAEDLRALGANYGPDTILKGQFWRLGICLILHAGFLHFAANLALLWFAGRLVEHIFGAWRYLALYALAGFGGALASVWWSPDSVSVGSSGAIFGLLGALLAYVNCNAAKFKPELTDRFTMGVVALAAYGILQGLVRPGIDNAAHVGGLLCGLAAGWLLLPPAKAGRLPWREAVCLVSFLALFAFVYTKLDSRVRYSKGVIAEAKRTAFNDYQERVRSVLEPSLETLAQTSKTLKDETKVSDTRALADAHGQLEESIRALRRMEVSDPEIAELHALFVKFLESQAANAAAATEEPSTNSTSRFDLWSRVRDSYAAQEQFLAKRREFLERYNLTVRKMPSD